MAYVATFSLEHGPWLVRVDTDTYQSLERTQHYVRFTITDAYGGVSQELAPISATDPSTQAILALVHDLNFHGIHGGINLVHADPSFSDERWLHLLQHVSSGLALRQMATSAVRQ